MVSLSELTVAALALSRSVAAVVQNSTEGKLTIFLSPWAQCDALIAAGLGDQLYLAPDAEYAASMATYFSASVQALKPWCILQPASTQDVSAAVKALSQLSTTGNWEVAVRSGGHSHWPSNNAGRGVTIDLSLLNSTIYSNGIAQIGTGARWGPVYAAVEEYGQSLVGGREGHVGVGGLILGGGLSFYSARRGLAADNVANFEVVLADGTITDVNNATNPDLFKALKGGGSNLAIVTRFDLETFPSDGIWAGLVFMSYDERDAVIDQFVRLISINSNNTGDTESMSFIYDSTTESSSIAVQVVNLDGVANSTSFAPLADIPVLFSDTKERNISEFITTYESPGGSRSVWFSLCFHNSVEMVTEAANIFDDVTASLQVDLPDAEFSINFIFQPLAQSFGEVRNGGNVVGLDQTLTADSVVWLVMAFADTVDTEAYLWAKLAAATAQLEAYAQSQNANTAWRYHNYVNPEQDPLSSYGAQNVAYIKQVAETYDPQGFFQHHVRGGFKISSVE
ncbi:FAD binding domain-containing protein [Xylariales sp. PMI_506]|nr:FAD binding domain-containing protein [Xylariales sp. PMI_506]